MADGTGAGGVMCPSWLATRDEKDTTRGRSRVLQEAVNGTLVRGLASPEVHEALDLCLACKGCLSDCPTGVDMATYKAEVLHQTYRGRPRPAAHYSLGWLPRWAAAASRAPRLANLLLATPPLAAAAKRLGGVDPRRPLPRFADPDPPRQVAPPPGGRAGPGRPAPGAAVARHLHRPLLARGGAGRRPGPGGRRVPGRPPRRAPLLRSHLDLHRPAGHGQTRAPPHRRPDRDPDREAGSGVRSPMVGLEPSCLAVLRHDALGLLGADDPAAVAVARAAATLAEVLAAAPGWDPPDLSGVAVVAQPHCHQHAVLGWAADRDLLARAGAEVTAVGGCCGLAGNFGAERGHYDVSVAVAETALLPAVRAAGPDAVVLADGFSCRTQLDHLAGRRALHLAELLDPARHRP